MATERRTSDGQATSTPTTAQPLVTRRVPVPPDIRALSPLVHPGYLDAFTLAAGAPGHAPEQWARAMFADVAGWQGQLIWRVLLGLRLHRAPDRVAGWHVAHADSQHIRIEARSWFLTGHLVVAVAAGEVTLATFIGYDRRLAGWVWGPLSRVHRRIAPDLLRDGRRTLLG